MPHREDRTPASAKALGARPPRTRCRRTTWRRPRRCATRAATRRTSSAAAARRSRACSRRARGRAWHPRAGSAPTPTYCPPGAAAIVHASVRDNDSDKALDEVWLLLVDSTDAGGNHTLIALGAGERREERSTRWRNRFLKGEPLEPARQRSQEDPPTTNERSRCQRAVLVAVLVALSTATATPVEAARPRPTWEGARRHRAQRRAARAHRRRRGDLLRQDQAHPRDPSGLSLARAAGGGDVHQDGGPAARSRSIATRRWSIRCARAYRDGHKKRWKKAQTIAAMAAISRSRSGAASSCSRAH